jgi:hypothetical protein
MKIDVGMALEPAVVLGFVGIETVQNDMNFFFVAAGVYDPIHEIQELVYVPSPKSLGFAAGQLAVFQGTSEAPLSASKRPSEQRRKTANRLRPTGLAISVEAKIA